MKPTRGGRPMYRKMLGLLLIWVVMVSLIGCTKTKTILVPESDSGEIMVSSHQADRWSYDPYYQIYAQPDTTWASDGSFTLSLEGKGYVSSVISPLPALDFSRFRKLIVTGHVEIGLTGDGFAKCEIDLVTQGWPWSYYDWGYLRVAPLEGHEYWVEDFSTVIDFERDPQARQARVVFLPEAGIYANGSGSAMIRIESFEVIGIR